MRRAQDEDLRRVARCPSGRPANGSPTAALVAACVIALVVAGCQSTTTTTNPRPMDSGQKVTANQAQSRTATQPGANWSTDPCATRLHDLGGALLMYYTINHKLPSRMDELLTVPGAEPDLQPVCPVSNTPYVFNPRGILMPETKARVVIYDPAPSHFGVRWAVTITEPEEEGGAMVTKVIALPESTFRFQPGAR